MSNVIDLDAKRAENEPGWFNFWAMCLPCKHKWIAAVHVSISVFKLQCPQCMACDSFGSMIPEEYIETMRELLPGEEEDGAT